MVFSPDSKTLVLGRLDGTAHLWDVTSRREVATIHALSAHADRDEMLRWLNGFAQPPRAVYAVHGEDQAARAFVQAIAARSGWSAAVAQDKQTITL